MPRLRTVSLGLALAALVAVLAACSAAGPVQLAPGTVVIDVRTPAEYLAGHLRGAVNVDLQSGTFEQQIAGLAADGEYVVYCRSGSRSGQAAAIMKDKGFTHVRDAGAMQAASGATGLPVVSAG